MRKKISGKVYLGKINRKKSINILFFIGASIPKIYLINYPSCLEVLRKLWKMIETQEGVYKHLLVIKVLIIA